MLFRCAVVGGFFVSFLATKKHEGLAVLGVGSAGSKKENAKLQEADFEKIQPFITY